jgi:hypothetical protein
MRRLSTAFALIILLSGCNAQWHLKRAIHKNPAILTDGVVIERVTDTIEVVVPELRVDTLHAWSVDTVTSYVDRVRIRTKVDTIARTVYIDVVCPADTIYVPYEYEKMVIQPTVRKAINWKLIAVIVILSLCIIALLPLNRRY